MLSPPYPIQPEAVRKSWLERNPRWKIPLGALILILLVGIFVVGLLAVILTSFQRSDVYRQAVSRVRESPQVREQLGEPIEAGMAHCRGLEGEQRQRPCRSFDTDLGPSKQRPGSSDRRKEWWRVAFQLPPGQCRKKLPIRAPAGQGFE
jgi:hypothetical protein